MSVGIFIPTLHFFAASSGSSDIRLHHRIPATTWRCAQYHAERKRATPKARTFYKSAINNTQHIPAWNIYSNSIYTLHLYLLRWRLISLNYLWVILLCVTERSDEESEGVDITLVEDIIGRVSSVHCTLTCVYVCLSLFERGQLCCALACCGSL